MPLRRREPNCRPPNIRLQHATEREREGERERVKLISKVTKQDNLPVIKSDVVNKYIKYFLEFTNTINFKKL